MNSAATTSIAYKWFEAFNNHNLDQLLSLYDEKAQHFSPKLKTRKPETNGLVEGKEAMRAWWKDALDRFPSLKYQVTSITANENRVFMEYIRSVNDEPDLLVAEVLDVRDGKIVFSRVYHG
jgi:limonene-1,2-epoxide hydrolase